jgi:hypothetical protein
VTIGEAIALAGVVFAAGAAIERLRRYEGAARAQYKRVGDTVAEVAELRGQVRVLLRLLPEGRGVVMGSVPTNAVEEPPAPPAVRPIGNPPIPPARGG